MFKNLLIYGGALGVSAFSVYKLSAVNGHNNELVKQIEDLEEDVRKRDEKKNDEFEKVKKKHALLMEEKERAIRSQKKQLEQHFNDKRRLINKLKDESEKFEVKEKEFLLKISKCQNLIEIERKEYEEEKRNWETSDPGKKSQLVQKNHEKEVTELREQTEKKMKIQKEEFEKEKNIFKKQIKQSREALEKFKDENEKKEREVLRNLRIELTTTRNKVKEYEAKLDSTVPLEKYKNLQKQLEELNEKISKLESENFGKNEVPSNEPEKIQEENKDLKEQINNLSDFQEKYEDLMEKFREKENELKELTENSFNEELQKKYGRLMKIYHDQETELNSLKEENHKLQENLEKKFIDRSKEDLNRSLSSPVVQRMSSSGNKNPELMQFKRKMTAVIRKYKTQISLKDKEIEQLKINNNQ